ncbi:MAG: hypothetical protein QCI82_00170 [Candidatus Thermoplasmatota archaeon]|nr:hypothetical protein [Candidatus Thermoplasmatota archaeon]
MYREKGHGIARKVGCILAVSLFLICADGLSKDLISEGAEALRPVLVIIELNATSKYQEGNMAWILSGPPRMDSQGRTQESGLAIVEGRITVYKVARLLRQKIIVTLSARTDDTDLLVSVNPPIMEFEAYTKIQTKSFKAAIRLSTPMIPYSTAQEFPKKVEVFGTWMTQVQTGTPNEGGIIDPHPIYARIKPFYYMQVITDPPFIKMLPGQTRTVDVIIKNQGNAFDRYDVMIPQEGMLAKRGWVFEMNRTSVLVGPMSDGLIRLTITSPRRFQSPYHMGVQSFLIHAESFNTQELVDQGELMTKQQYDTDVMISLIGPDIIYVPMVWAAILYLALALVLFNMGVSIFTLRRRRFLMPEGKQPGFKWAASMLFKLSKGAGGRTLAGPSKRADKRERRGSLFPRKRSLTSTAPSPVSVLRPTMRESPPKELDIDVSNIDAQGITGKGRSEEGPPLFTKPKGESIPPKSLDEILDDL